jgi:hypothetical protein
MKTKVQLMHNITYLFADHDILQLDLYTSLYRLTYVIHNNASVNLIVKHIMTACCSVVTSSSIILIVWHNSVSNYYNKHLVAVKVRKWAPE